jgi:hypothetical protein
MHHSPEESNLHIHLRRNLTSDKMATPPTQNLLKAKTVFCTYCGTKEKTVGEKKERKKNSGLYDEIKPISRRRL